jgi:Ca2+-dependent lipid-binding protein
MAAAGRDYRAFIVVVVKAENLRAADFGLITSGKSDPYVKISTPTCPGCLEERTHVIQNNLNPVWDTGFIASLPNSVPAVLKFNIFDSDAGTLIDGSDVSCSNARCIDRE